MLVHSGLKILGRSGYELLIDDGINKTRDFSKKISLGGHFELTSDPVLNILTYRYRPAWLDSVMRDCDSGTLVKLNEVLSSLTKYLQKTQRGHGKSFVSRTQLTPQRYNNQAIIVFRVVLANPLTTMTILDDILAEQLELANAAPASDYQAQLHSLAEPYLV